MTAKKSLDEQMAKCIPNSRKTYVTVESFSGSEAVHAKSSKKY